MTDVITLSSSEDEEAAPVTKKIKSVEEPIPIVLSDEEEAGEKLIANGTVPHIQIDENTNVVKASSDTEELPPLLRIVTASSSTTEPDPIEIKLTAFIDKCLQAIKLSHMRNQLSRTLPKMKGHYEKLCKLNVDMKDLSCMLDSDKNLPYDSYKAVVRYSEIFDFLKSKLKSAENDKIFSGPKRQLLHKLEQTLLLVRKKIKLLDEAEVDFNDEENSNYIKAARYKERAHMIFTKICEMRKEDPNEGRLAYAKLNFTHSKYPLINKVLNKKYNNIIEFPTYYEMDRCIRKYVEAKELKITEEELKSEIKFCFEKLGTIMQRKRQLDLYDTHMDFIQNEEDPASKDEEIAKKLQDNLVKGNDKMQKVLEKYTKLQESGANTNVSSDSDDSHLADSD